MSRFRAVKAGLKSACAAGDWPDKVRKIILGTPHPKEIVSPFIALLPMADCRLQAAWGLGFTVSLLAGQDIEAARTVMRRLMWSLNEESGNLGWGVPEAMGAILAASPVLAGEYGRIFLSYGYETGKHDNFLEYAPLRRGLYQGIASLAETNPLAAAPALVPLTRAVRDPDPGIRALAALALRQLALGTSPEVFAGPGRAEWLDATQALAMALDREGNDYQTSCLAGTRIFTATGDTLLREALREVERRLA